MKLPAMWLAAVALGVCASESFAQPGTTVQLPTFSFFSVGTTVSVPDRGSVTMGGVSRSATGRNEFGTPLMPFRPFRNTAIGKDVSASGMRVSATIHDFAAMDEHLLNQPTSFRSRQLSVLENRRNGLAASGYTLQPRDPSRGSSWQVAPPRSSAESPQMSLADARSRRAKQQTARSSEAADFFERGRQAEATGKTSVAKIYYQMAARRADEAMQPQIAARLAAISGAESSGQIARGRP
ncbi:MAG: hypothetical protein HQ567_19255 [Candidatus Nealsonbacteria bacterium]|nr:hypothetical protein [Candidatus Nealsonbacteria bacterium]